MKAINCYLDHLENKPLEEWVYPLSFDPFTIGFSMAANAVILATNIGKKRRKITEKCQQVKDKDKHFKCMARAYQSEANALKRYKKGCKADSCRDRYDKLIEKAEWKAKEQLNKLKDYKKALSDSVNRYFIEAILLDDTLTEQEQINEIEEVLNESLTAAAVVGGAALVYGAGLWSLIKKLDEAGRMELDRCSDLSHKETIKQCRVSVAKKNIAKFKSAKNKCKNDKCKAGLDKKISMWQRAHKRYSKGKELRGDDSGRSKEKRNRVLRAFYPSNK